VLSRGTLGVFDLSVDLCQFSYNSDWDLHENRWKEQQVFVDAMDYKYFRCSNDTHTTILTHLP